MTSRGRFRRWAPVDRHQPRVYRPPLLHITLVTVGHNRFRVVELKRLGWWPGRPVGKRVWTLEDIHKVAVQKNIKIGTLITADNKRLPVSFDADGWVFEVTARHRQLGYAYPDHVAQTAQPDAGQVDAGLTAMNGGEGGCPNSTGKAS
jgi:hypothetical protein